MDYVILFLAIAAIVVALFIQTSPTKAVKNLRRWISFGRKRPHSSRKEQMPPISTSPRADSTGDERTPSRGPGGIAEEVRAFLAEHRSATLYQCTSASRDPKEGEWGEIELPSGEHFRYKRAAGADWQWNSKGFYIWELILGESGEVLCTSRADVSGK